MATHTTVYFESAVSENSKENTRGILQNTKMGDRERIHRANDKKESDEFYEKNAQLVEIFDSKFRELRRRETQEPILQEHLARVSHLPVLESWLAYQALEENFKSICALRQEVRELQRNLLLKRRAFAEKRAS